MTNKEAIYIINNRLNTYYCTEEDLQALDLAIKALEERPQGEFTDLEKKVTADAINYLLGAELLEENGYTKEVINALKSALQKLGAEEDHL